MLKMVCNLLAFITLNTCHHLYESNIPLLFLFQGLPIGAVQNALQRDGLDPSVMEMDPEKSLEYQKACATRKPTKQKTPAKKEPR